MKTVSGKIVSTKPVILSKAATILSNFVTIENGASQSVSTYLRRASVAFNELVYFKKHHKLKKKRTKDDGLTKSDFCERNLEDDEVRVMENGGVNRKFDHCTVEIEENGMRRVEGESRKKEKKKKKKRDGSLGSEKNDNVEEGNENVKEKSDEKKKKKKKKRKNEEVDGGEVGNLVTPERKKKRRKTEAADE